MKTLSLFAIISIFAAPLVVMGQTTIFSDSFSSGGLSTLNPTATSSGTLTATRTAYCVASSKAATSSSIASGVFTLTQPATSSGFTEAGALFTAAPVTLSSPGQYIELYFTFTDTANIFNGMANTNMQICLGLFNSAGIAPTNGTLLWNSGLASGSNTATNGAAKGWLGYSGQFAYTYGAAGSALQSSAITARTNQIVANNLCQGLDIGSGANFTANITTLAGVVGQPLLTVGNQYTIALKLTYVNATTIAVTNTLYNGAGIGGSIFSSGGYTGNFGANASSAQTVTFTFDALSVGYRPTQFPSSTADSLQINNITVIDNINPPVGPGFNVTGGGIGCPSSAFAIGLSGSVTTNNYYLYTNSVSSGQMVTGTGSAISFGPQSIAATYTVLASNTVSSSTGLMNSNAVIAIIPGPCISAPSVFVDNFNSGSTVNGTSTPGGTTTASSTSYDIASTKTATNSLSKGHLKIGLSANTSGGYFEAQALFAAAPVTLTTPGDYITFTYTFTDSANLLAGGSGSAIYAGLYNSGGAAPVAGSLAAAGLTATANSIYAAGNCSNWLGYVSTVAANTGTSKIYTRPSQNAGGTASANQELIGSGNGNGTYNNPVGVQLGSGISSVSLTTGAQYTLSCTIALTAAGTLTITNNLYDNTSTLIYSQTNTATGADNLTQSFDGFCIGVLNNGTSLDPIMDINQVTVSASIAATPGPSFSVTGGGAGCSGDSFLVGLSGSVTNNNYFLYTNGVFSGQIISGLLSNNLALSFGPQSAVATYTILASNTATSITGLMSGSVTISVLPAPVITKQPVTVIVASGFAGVFSTTATGVGLGYQWYKNGVVLNDGGNISGSATSTLTVNPATTLDAATTVNGYYVVVTNTCGLSATSATNALIIDSPANLTWLGGNPNTNWDVATTLNWTNSAGVTTNFNSGDNVTLDDSSTHPVVTLVGGLYPTIVNEAAGQNYVLTGSGGIAGPGSLVMNGSGTLTISNANTYTGGTTINSGVVNIKNSAQSALGTGLVNLSGGRLEIGIASGSATTGLSNLNVTANSTLQVDTAGTFSFVVLNVLTGAPNATLTINNGTPFSSTASRVRMYGIFTNNAAMNFVVNGNGNELDWSPYNSSGNQVYNGLISGNGGRFNIRAAGTVIFNNTNTFNDSGVIANGAGPNATPSAGYGYSVLISGGTVGLGADSVSASPPTIDSSPVGTGILGINFGPSEGGNATIFASGGAHTVANAVVYTTANTNFILTVGGSNNLTLSGQFNLDGADGSGNTNRTLQINNTGLTTLSGVITDNGHNCGLIKTGNGPLYLDGINTYSGSTTVSSGVLAGVATIAGPVTVAGGGSIGGGGSAAIGTLTINNNLTLSGNALFKINPSVSPSNDVIAVSGTLTNTATGTLTVTNLGLTLIPGQQFFVFNKALSNGAAITVAGAGYTWTNHLALDGSIIAGPAVVVGTDLAIGASGPATVNPAVNFSYNLAITNLGPASASSVVVTDSLPTGLTFVSASGGGINNSGVINWSLGGLTSGQISNLTLTVAAPTYGSITNKASVSSATTDTALPNNLSPQVVTTVIPVTTSPSLTNSISGSNLTLQWPVDHTGWRLLQQTNNLSSGISSNTNDWGTVAGSTTTNLEIITIDAAKPTEFYQLVYP